MQQSGEQEPFIDEILRNLQRITADLSPLQIHTFYEAVGYMISAQPNKPQQEQLIANLMAAPNAAVSLVDTESLTNADRLSLRISVGLYHGTGSSVWYRGPVKP